ncbi:Os01g0382450, partial [Oryza sativa Japonica Group]
TAAAFHPPSSSILFILWQRGNKAHRRCTQVTNAGARFFRCRTGTLTTVQFSERAMLMPNKAVVNEISQDGGFNDKLYYYPH